MEDLDPTVPMPGHAEIQVPGFRILSYLGEGGMGQVYEAEQLEPVRREVALKVIKWGMDTVEVVARFRSERQALALMDHPSIAKVFDAGSTSSGRPYFVMELVRGEPLTEYCDRARLSIRERLELLVRVCNAMQHAHQKGIIHRDLKPSNVLVRSQDGVPVPMIIDFGLAKATVRREIEHSVFTEYGQLIGTPEYMSPEQAELSGLDVDTRSDIYSLGVLLYGGAGRGSAVRPGGAARGRARRDPADASGRRSRRGRAPGCACSATAPPSWPPGGAPTRRTCSAASRAISTGSS